MNVAMNLQFLQSRSIKTRVTLFTLGIFLTSTWVLSLYASRTLQTDMQRVLGEQQLSTAFFIAGGINDDLSDRIKALEAVATRVTPADMGTTAAAQRLLEERPILGTLFNGGITIVASDGTAIADVPRSNGRIGVNYITIDYVAASLKEGKAMIGKPIMGPTLKAPVVGMGVPIRDPRGQVIGVLSGVIRLDKPNFMDKITQNRSDTNVRYIVVAPQHGLNVTASDKSRIMAKLPEPGVNPMMDRFAQGTEGTFVFVNPLGETVLGSAIAIPVAHWYAAVTLAAEDAFAPIHQMQRRMLLVAILLTLMSGGLTWWMLRREFMPLAHAVQTLTLLANSDQPSQIISVAHKDEIGKLIGSFNVLITTLTQRDAALRESEARFRQVVELIPDAVVVHRSGKLLHANPAGVSMFGATTEQELIGKPVLELIHPDFHAIVLARLKRAIEHGEAAGSIEERYVKLDGTCFDAEVQGQPIVLAGQTAVLVTLRDITERKAAQDKLQLAAGVFTHALEGIMITTPDATIIDVNDAFTRITGYSRDDAIGQNPRILSSGRQGPEYFTAMWRSLIDDGYWYGEVWNRRKNGEVFAEMQAVSAVRDAQGKVSQYISLFSDITDRKEHERQLEHIAHFDALTNLPNRVLLADRLQQAMAQAQRRGQQLAVAYLDLDGFKSINDQHGHEAGDQMLITLAKRMKEALREGDTLARMGGDEFVAVLIDLEDTSASVPLLERMLAAAALPVQVDGLMLQVSASLGVTFHPQEHDIDADQLLRQADQAMYQAKLAGKNRYQIFDAAQDSNLRVHHESLERIRLALAQREFVLFYQPKVNMHSGQVIGAEALIRWQHPEKDLLAPATFLPVIEDHPLAVEVGEWVIDTALIQIERWHAAGLDLPVSVNIGARQLQQGDFVLRLQAILARHPQVNPINLELEVLETSALSDMAQVSQVIEECAKIGVKFALDDFGTGYSSLTYLKRLRVALLKIDQSFVRDMLDDPDDLAILQGVIGLAAAFKREVIAEGVETVAHGTALLQLGCELAQGYGIARPMPPEQLPAWVATWQPDAAWCVVPGSVETLRSTDKYAAT
jgi:diguanylate cyclase (GGDEF)-like protein/PAS domain S-box-containing protein